MRNDLVSFHDKEEQMLEDSIPTLAILPMLLTLEYFGLTYNHGLEQIKSENCFDDIFVCNIPS